MLAAPVNASVSKRQSVTFNEHHALCDQNIFDTADTVREAIYITSALRTLSWRTSETGSRNRHLSIAQRSPDSERDFLWRHPPGGRRDRAEDAPGLRWVR